MSSRLGIGWAAGALLALVGCGGAGGEATPIGPPESSLPVSPVSASSFTDGTTLTTVEPERFEQYDVQPRRVEVGGTLTITALCELDNRGDVMIEPSNNALVATDLWWKIPGEDYRMVEGGHWRFEYRLTLDNAVGPGPMLVFPQCVGRPEIDPAPGDLAPSSTDSGYKPFEIQVTERAAGPRWASYVPIAASVEPTQVAPDGTVVVTAICPGDALPGLGRVIVRGAYTGPTGGDPVLAMFEVPPAAYTSDPASGTHTYAFAIDASQLADLDPPGTLLGPACTPGVDGGPPPLGGQQSVFQISLVDPGS